MTRIMLAPGRPFPAFDPAAAEFERTADIEPDAVVAELNRVKVAFQMRALCAALGMENVRVEVTAEQPSVAQAGSGTTEMMPPPNVASLLHNGGVSQ